MEARARPALGRRAWLRRSPSRPCCWPITARRWTARASCAPTSRSCWSACRRGRGCRPASCASRSPTRRWSARAGRCRGSTRSATWPRGSRSRSASWSGSPTCAGSSGVVDDERLRHYRYVHLPRKTGPPRVIERPKPRLKAPAAADPARAAGLDPGPRRRARLRPRALRGLARLAAHRAPRGRPARPRGLLRRRDRRARVRDLPHRGLSRVGRAHADRAVHQRRPDGASRSPGTTGSRAASPRRTCRRARRPRRRWPTSRPSGSTAG